MLPLLQATTFVLPDEKAYWLSEGWRPIPPLPGERRIQIIHVLRGDQIVLWEKDLGPKGNFQADKFQIPSFWEYSVAELQEIADYLREGKPLSNPEERLDLMACWAKELDERQMLRTHKSVYGPALVKVR